MIRLMSLAATSARMGACLGIALLIGCSDSDSTSGVTLQKTATDESGVTTITEETHRTTDRRQPGLGEAPSNVQSAGGLTVISPNGGEEWVPGKAYKIRWKKGTSLPHAAITIYPGSKSWDYEYIVAKTENDGSYTWKIPSSFRTGTDFRIYVESFSYHHACTDYSFLNQGYNYSYLITKNKNSNEGWPGNYCCGNSGAGSSNDGYAEAQDTLSWLQGIGACSLGCEIIDVNGDNCKSNATAYDGSNKSFTIS
ncbi:MAG: Ser-Thr-rich GPI-anchored membrane family protein, partial [Alphaproteobacteria bacterium]|nr:Ser-Thr-rich GPI-anchored membrane family protein [Alphaproteobacteria bacterium]